MSDALRAEFTKARTAPGIGWFLAAIVVSTVALSWAATAATTCELDSCDIDPVKLSLTGIQLSQALVVTFAISMVGIEYSSGMVIATLSAIPRRLTVLAAKATVVSAATLAAAIVAVPAALLAGRAALAANGHPDFPLTAEPTLRAVLGSIGLLVLMGLFGVGVAFVARTPTAAIGIALGLLYVFPLLVMAVNDLDLARFLNRISPLNAGLTIQATTDVAQLPITPLAGLGVLAAWAVVALVGGGASLRLRDA